MGIQEQETTDDQQAISPNSQRETS
jgi:hypothetical protein